MKLTLKQTFERFPIPISKVAYHLGYSREWLSAIAQGRLTVSQSKREQHCKMIQQYLRQIGEELSQIEIIYDKKD